MHCDHGVQQAWLIQLVDKHVGSRYNCVICH